MIANYGNKKMYVVSNIDFDSKPGTTTFKMATGDTISISEYFFKTYQLKITHEDQPMLVVKV